MIANIDIFQQVYKKDHKPLEEEVFTTLKSKALQEGIARYGVGAVVFHRHRYLLLEKKNPDAPGGIYEIPHGEVHDGESLDKAIRREVRGLTGLSVKNIKEYLGCFDTESEEGEMARQFNFLVSVNFPLRVTLQKHRCHSWAEKDDLGDYHMKPHIRQLLQTYF